MLFLKNIRIRLIHSNGRDSSPHHFRGLFWVVIETWGCSTSTNLQVQERDWSIWLHNPKKKDLWCPDWFLEREILWSEIKKTRKWYWFRLFNECVKAGIECFESMFHAQIDEIVRFGRNIVSACALINAVLYLCPISFLYIGALPEIWGYSRVRQNWLTEPPLPKILVFGTLGSYSAGIFHSETRFPNELDGWIALAKGFQMRY